MLLRCCTRFCRDPAFCRRSGASAPLLSQTTGLAASVPLLLQCSWFVPQIASCRALHDAAVCAPRRVFNDGGSGRAKLISHPSPGLPDSLSLAKRCAVLRPVVDGQLTDCRCRIHFRSCRRRKARILEEGQCSSLGRRSFWRGTPSIGKQ